MTTQDRMRSPTPLALIKQGAPDSALEMLLSRSWLPGTLDVQTDQDGTPLFWASLRGYALVTEVLLMLGADVNSKSIASGSTPLHGAADNGRVDIVKILLNSSADMMVRNYFQDTPCHQAAYRGNAEIVSQLLKSGADCRAKNSRGNNVLDEAKCGQYTIANGQHSLVQYIINVHLSNTSTEDNLEQNHTATDQQLVAPLSRDIRTAHVAPITGDNRTSTQHCATCTCHKSCNR